jgi:hypothetical protein
MLTIDKSTELTVYDFMKNKEYKPFKDWRTVAKTENFGLLFGCSAGTFGGMLQQANFTETECEEYIKLKNLTAVYNAALSNAGGKSPKDIKFLVVADDMRNSFFKSYEGLMGRIKREQMFALAHGYVRAWHGPVRHLAELRYMSVNEQGNLTGADRSLYSKIFAHILNNACNSTIQSMESRIAFSTWVNTSKYLALWGLKSYCWNNIHDSLDFYVWKPELQLVMSLANACAAWDREPVKGIHMSFDGEVSDVQDYEHRYNTYYKAGVGYDPLPIEEAIKNYNAKNGTNFKWYGCDWIYDNFMPNRKEFYDYYCKLNSKLDTDNFIKAWGGVIPEGVEIIETAKPARRIING